MSAAIISSPTGQAYVKEPWTHYTSPHFSPGFVEGGADGHGYKARDGRIPQATCSEAAGLDKYVEGSDHKSTIKQRCSASESVSESLSVSAFTS